MKTWWIITLLLLDISSNFVTHGKIKVLKGNNPGLCSKKNSGEVMLIRDRQNKHKLLICTNDNGVYGWRTLDGSSPSGEFFSPGYDCSSILDKDPKAKDGFYWITMGEKIPKKVWCDMTTDGGGFILIGRKNTSVTWTVPSNNQPVEPFGIPHWTSSLGNAPVIDFRVQVATTENFKTTKAHWFYRLRNPRALKNLMIINKGGCGNSSPGVGDVQFVKDLMTNNIVTTKFRCSKFGVAHNRRAQFGWAMMNYCLNRPCRWGFAFHHKYPFQTDYSGAFSYSTKNRISGINYGATALVGCDNGKCCGCYGPKSGKKNYCFKECKAQNGGTIRKSVYTWFWVRTSLPNRLWSKCMEYKVIENGTRMWYKLVGDSKLPMAGRCAKDKPLFYEGMLVVPDNTTAKKVPKVEGMMVYRKDNKKVYVQGDKKLNALAEEKKILGILDKDIAELKSKFDRFNQTYGEKIRSMHSRDSAASTVLKGEPESFFKQLKQWFSFNKLRCCWRASLDGWDSHVFHDQCDYRGKTITLIKVGKYIFGGYSTYYWGGSGGTYRSSSSNYIFSLRNKDNLSPFRSRVYRNSGHAIYTNPGYGPTFGGGHDIYIANNADKSRSSRANLGYTYLPPSGYSYGNSKTQALLAGSNYFTPTEVEVYYYV